MGLHITRHHENPNQPGDYRLFINHRPIGWVHPGPDGDYDSLTRPDGLFLTGYLSTEACEKRLRGFARV